MYRIAIVCFFGIIYLCAGLYLLFNVDAVIRADANDVYQYAKAFTNGDYAQLDQGGYLFRFPYQLGLLSFFRILMLFSSNLYFFYFSYLVFVILINYVLWKISELYFADNAIITKFVIVFSFLFVPQLFFILFLYGTIPGLLCVLCSILFTSRYFKYNKISQCFLGVLFMVLACVLCNNYMIAGIALCILLFIHWLKETNFRNAFAIVVLLVGILFCNKLVIKYYEFESGKTINGGVPMSLYVAMGLQDDEEFPSRGGWYNAYVWWTYDAADFDNEKANSIAMDSIRGSIHGYVTHPRYMIEFFGNKIRTTWCEPTFQSVWSGPLADYGQMTHTKLL